MLSPIRLIDVIEMAEDSDGNRFKFLELCTKKETIATIPRYFYERYVEEDSIERIKNLLIKDLDFLREQNLYHDFGTLEEEIYFQSLLDNIEREVTLFKIIESKKELSHIKIYF